MKRTMWDVSVIVRGPVLTKSSAIGAPGFDAVMARGTFASAAGPVERFYLPGALIKGLLREAWQELSVADSRYLDWCDRWLGRKSDDEDNEPQRGRLQFTDFADVSTPTNRRQPKRYRIQVEETRGAATGKMLQVIESPYAPGSAIEFRGTVRTTAPEPEMADAILRGLLWIRAAGGNRSIGFGQVLGASLSETVVSQPTSQTFPQEDTWELRMTFSQPVVFSKRRISGNFFESSEVIPGAALTGAIAATVHEKPGFEKLASELSHLRFTHAFPTATGGQRPLQLPLSLVRFGDDPPVDAIRLAEPPAEKLGAFRIDWKEPQVEDALKQTGWPVDLRQELRVRTAISSETRKAKDEDLFAWQALVPHGLEWIATVDVSDLSAGARTQLAALLAFGLEPLGKTKACAAVTFRGETLKALGSAQDYVVTLQTPALLVAPSRIAGNRGEEAAVLRSEYERAWQELCPALKLVNYFGACSLAGGEYLHRRFGNLPQYKPYLLVEAGSTFLLEAAPDGEDEARASLEGFVRRGLPLRRAVRDYYDIPEAREQQWKRCPYTPHNGYGEIAVNSQQTWPEA